MTSIGSPSPLFFGKKKAYEIERSLRFNTTDQTILTSSLSTSPTNRKKTTLSFWFKKSKLSYGQGIITSGASGTGSSASGTLIYLNSNDTFKVTTQVSNSTVWSIVTNRVFRDSSAWIHFCMSLDTTQSTASDRVKIYFNGVQETSFSSASYPSQNYDDIWAYGNYRIGDYGGDYGYYYGYDGCIAEVITIDGQALDPSSFTETNAITGQLIPKDPSVLTFGTNGFHLKFADNSGTTATTLGKDSSGNSNNFTPSNFSVAAGDGNDSITDTPTLNKATLNPITGFTYNATLTEGNLKMSGSNGFKEISTIAFAGTSKFYYEVVNTSAAGWQLVGVFVGQPNNPSNALSNSAIWGFASTQATYYGGSYTSTSNVPSWTTNDVMGIKYENGSLKLYKNGTLATATTTSVPTSDIVFAYIANDNASATAFVRFNSDSWTQDSAAGVDATWELSTANLPDPTIKLPNKHFAAFTYAGTGSSGDVVNITNSNVDFTPDWVWVKTRDVTNDHILSDAVRGGTKYLVSSENYAEQTDTDKIRDFIQNGFESGTDGDTNWSGGRPFVAWNWNAGGSTVTNNDGNNTSQVRANTSAGFSIVGYTGTGANNTNVTMGHGLGVTPDFIWIKNRSSAALDRAWHLGLSSDSTYNIKNIIVNSDSGEGGYASQIRDYSSSTFTVRDVDANGNLSVNKSGDNYIAYCFSGVEGFSKFGKYEGNGSSNGTFVFTGFSPAWVMVKRINNNDNWGIYDIARDTTNVMGSELFANVANAEQSNSSDIDFVSNGFKLRRNYTYNNGAGTFIYLAFAESPFKNARAR